MTDTETLVAEVLAGNRRSLARAITLVESSREDHRAAAVQMLEHLAPASGKSTRIGISGVPGVGKSTFIEALGNHVADLGHRVAVLAVDPSSAITGGSILGDKTRMETLSQREDVFIRPSPTGGTLGGVTRRTRESMLICEAAAYDVIIVETVGVGQSETAVADMTDMFLLMLLPGGGDELQGIKRGIMELADMIIVNKADGEMAATARHSASDYLSAIKLLHPRTRNWSVPVKTCSALERQGVDEIWNTVEEYCQVIDVSGEKVERRAQQAKSWMWSEISEGLINALRQDQKAKQRIDELEQAVVAGTTAPTLAATELIDLFLKSQVSD